MSAKATPWTLKGPQAALACGQLSAHVDLREFDLGVHAPLWKDSRLEARVLGPQLPLVVGGKLALTEIYVRGPDLVASCERPGPLPVVPQFYWRAQRHESQSAVSIELIVSMRTDLLDSQPQISVETFSRCNEALVALRLEADGFRAAAPAALARAGLAGGEVPAFLFRHQVASYFQMVHPDDFFAVELTLWRKRHPRLVTTLFPERLEKGVIRRARICGWFLPAENDLAVAVELARQFVDEPLPLTT